MIFISPPAPPPLPPPAIRALCSFWMSGDLSNIFAHPKQGGTLRVFKYDEVSKNYDSCIVSRSRDLAESKYVG